MSTRSNIGIRTGKNEGKFIYCHFDGYLNGVGYTLYNYYTTKEKVEELIALGDISSLGKEVAPPKTDSTHSWEHPTEGVTVAYHRDRGEELREACLETLKPFSDDIFIEYVYLFDPEDGKWYVHFPYSEMHDNNIESHDNWIPMDYFYQFLKEKQK